MHFAMRANSRPEETALVEAAARWLREHLPPSWAVQPAPLPAPEPGFADDGTRPDAVYQLTAPGGVFAIVVMEAKRSFGPRDVERLLAGVSRLLRRYIRVQFLVVAPWLSERTRQLLVDDGINFFDLTGNAYLRLDNPAAYIKTTGASRDPSPGPRGAARVKGPRAARLIRLLADVLPPYGVRDIAQAAALNPGYVSRLLETLDAEALIERSPKGRVESVDVSGLLRRWAEWYDVFASNQASTYIAPSGVRSLLDRLRSEDIPGRWAVTGSFAAARLSPVAAPALLTLYRDDERDSNRDDDDRGDVSDRDDDGGDLSRRLSLLPADQGADVVLLRPFDPVVWERAMTDGEGVMYVAPSQVAVDCLTGNGRMPAEGEAVLEWMIKNEEAWRLSSLRAVGGINR